MCVLVPEEFPGVGVAKEYLLGSRREKDLVEVELAWGPQPVEAGEER